MMVKLFEFANDFAECTFDLAIYIIPLLGQYHVVILSKSSNIL